MLFEDPSLQLLLMIVCALESLQRSLNTEESYCFSTTFEGWDQLLCYCYCYCYCVIVIVGGTSALRMEQRSLLLLLLLWVALLLSQWN